MSPHSEVPSPPFVDSRWLCLLFGGLTDHYSVDSALYSLHSVEKPLFTPFPKSCSPVGWYLGCVFSLPPQCKGHLAPGPLHWFLGRSGDGKMLSL